MSKNIKNGIAFALLASLISGISIFYNKQVSVKGIDSTIFNILKNGGVAIILSILILATKEWKTNVIKLEKNISRLLLIGLIGGSIPFVLFFEGLKSVPAINASIIQKTLFVWAGTMAVLLLKEKVSPVQIIGYLLIFASNFIIGGFTGFGLNSAELLIFVATLFWSVENIIAKQALNSVDSKIVVWGRMFLGTLILIVYAAFSQKLLLLGKVKPDHILPVMGSIILLTGYVLTWYKALSLAPVTVVTAILILATPITNILSAIFITHTIESLQLINLIISLCGVGLVAFFTAKVTRYEHKRIGSMR